RIRETEGPDEVEIYHNRVGAAVVAGLGPEASREHSRQLAMALEATTSDDPETLAVLFERCGHQDLAARHSITAAVRAAEALALDRAARLSRLALQFGRLDEPEKHRVEVRLADALANAGRGSEAGRTYLSAANAAPPHEKLDLQRRAAEQLLVSGHVDEGMAVARTVLGKVGITLGSSPRWALVSLLAHRAVVRLRGFRFRERDAAGVAADVLNRIDTCWSLTVGLIAVDIVRAADFGARHTLLALRAGEPSRVARALLIESTQSAMNGGRGRRRADDFVRRL